MDDHACDFKEKANAFANWCTSIAIANFVYLVGYNDKIFISRLGSNEWMWHWSFWSTATGLVAIFMFKALGVASPYLSTVNQVKISRSLEALRVVLFLVFLLSLITAAIFSFIIISCHFYLKSA